MDKIQQYRAAAFGEMIVARSHNHMMERLLCAIDNNEPCRDLDRAVKRLHVALLDARRATEEALEGLSSVEIMEAASPARIAELEAEVARLRALSPPISFTHG